MTVQHLRRLLCALLGPADFQKGEVLMIICAFICEIRMLFSQEVDSLYKTRLSKNISFLLLSASV